MNAGRARFLSSSKRFNKVSRILALGCLGFLGAMPFEANAYDQVGRACWYGPRLHGRTTASGEMRTEEPPPAARFSTRIA